MKKLLPVSILVISAAYSACFTARTTAGEAGYHFARIEVDEFVIEPRSLPDSAPVSHRDALLHRLADEATQQAIKTLRAHHIADEVEPATESSQMDVPVVSGYVEIPVDLPSSINGFTAGSRRGEFAAAHAEIKMPDGSVRQGNRISLSWNAVWWVNGGRPERPLPSQEVLAGFARKAADHCVLQLPTD